MPSPGCGESTQGDVTLSGRDIGSLNDRSRARLVAFVPQSPVVPEGMSVADYVLLGRVAHRSLLRAETPNDRSVVGEVLVRLDLNVAGGPRRSTRSRAASASAP